MSEKAPMPPWWVDPFEYEPGKFVHHIMGGSRKNPTAVCWISDAHFENAKELADLIVQRTADAKN